MLTGCVSTTISIRRPIEQVFDYVTSAANWPRCHPRSIGVSGVVERSARIGERVVEEFQVGERRTRVVWTVREHTAPWRWVADGRAGRVDGTMTYTLIPSAIGETTLHREFLYALPNPFLALFDPFLFRRHLEQVSVEALRRLKDNLESLEPDLAGKPADLVLDAGAGVEAGKPEAGRDTAAAR